MDDVSPGPPSSAQGSIADKAPPTPFFPAGSGDQKRNNEPGQRRELHFRDKRQEGYAVATT